ncbi:MAG: MATE family efflux transporter [Firmicutes bacterium]|nr:MATE family efflux transporter [Bacillota bacterium]
MEKYLGNRNFFNKFLMITLPIAIQNGITNVVSMVDNVMVGQLGTSQMNGVSIVNQIMLIATLCIFGAMAGAGIYTAQYYGSGNQEGIRYTFRFKMIIGAAIVTGAVLILEFFGENLIMLFLHGDNQKDIEVTLQYGLDYLSVAMWSLVPFGISQVYVSTMRETGQTLVPMKAGIAAVFVNIGLNYVMIFGKLGCPMLGVRGAALATICARFAEGIAVILWLHLHSRQNPFIVGAIRSFYIPSKLFVNILLKCIPLMINEALWAGGVAMLNQSYSTRGLDAVAGVNICSTITNVFNVFFIAVGEAIAIMVGQLLGAGQKDKARHADTVLCVYSVLGSAGLAVIMAACSPFFPMLYNTTDEVRSLATSFIIVIAFLLPVQAFTNASYFTLRSGGNTFITFIFDSVYMWCFTVPIAFVITRYTAINIVAVYAICQSLEIVKAVIGFIFVRKGVWINNIVDN